MFGKSVPGDCFGGLVGVVVDINLVGGRLKGR